MNRRLRDCVISLLAAMMLVLLVPAGRMDVYAATARISFSDPSAEVGQDFSVTVRVTSQDGSLGASNVTLSYDPAVLEFVSGESNVSGGAGTIRLVGMMDSNATTSFSYTLKFKAVQAGSTTISVGDYEVYDADTQPVNVTRVGSSAVTVKAPGSYSSDAELSSLKVYPGELSPAFSPSVTSYTVNVGGDVEKLAVSAPAKDSKAKVLISGDSGLQNGPNTVICKVTAEDGQTVKNYTITVHKSETVGEAEEPQTAAGEVVLGTQTVDIGGVQYTVAVSFDPAVLPEGYTSSTCTYGGTEIMSGTGNGLDLIYLQAGDGNGSLYIYNQESGALSPYVTIDVAAKSILVLPPDDSVEVPEGFVLTTIDLNETYEIQGWVWEADEVKRYCLVYGMNESGKKALYRYDKEERTFQQYVQDPSIKSGYDDAEVEKMFTDYHLLLKDYNLRFIVIIALIAASLILFFMVVNLLLRGRERAGHNEVKRDEAQTPVSRRRMEEGNGSRRPENRPSPEQSRSGMREPRKPAVPDPQMQARARTAASRMPDARERRPADSYERRYEGRGSSVGHERSGTAGAERRNTVSDRNAAPARNTAPARNAAPARNTVPERNAASGRKAAAERNTAADRRNQAPERRNSGSYSERPGYAEETRSRVRDAGMEEAIRQRELERAERARIARERLRQERLEDERRAQAAARERTRRRDYPDDDFEFIDLD